MADTVIPETLPLDFTGWDAPAQSPARKPTLGERNNNPGNLNFVGQKGATEGEGGFARWPTLEEGIQGHRNQIALDSSRGMNFRQYISKYAPPDKNDTEAYIKNGVNSLGIKHDTLLSEIDPEKLREFQQKQEGWPQAQNGPPATLPLDFQGWDKPDQLKTTPAPSGQTSFIKPDLDPANQALRNTGLQVRKPRGPDLPEGLKPDNPNAYAPSGLKWALPAGKEIETGVATMSDPSMERKAQGLHQVASGAAQLAAPAVLAGVGAPVVAATRIGAGLLAQKGVVEGGKALDVPEGYRNIAGDIVGAAVAGLPRRTPRAIGTPSPGAPPEATVVDKLAQAGRNWFAKGSRREVRKWPGGDYIVEAYDALTHKPKPTKAAVVKPAKPTPDPKPAPAREVQAQDILKRANVNREDLAGPKNPVAYSDIPADPGVSDPRALNPEYMPETNPVPTASPKDVGVMRSVLERSGQGQLPTRTPRPLSDPEVGTSTADFDAPATEKPIVVEPYKGFEPKGKYKFTPEDNQYGAPGRPTIRGEFTPPDEPVVEAAAATKFEPFKTSPRTQRLVRGRPADNPYGGSPGAKLARNGPPPPPKVEAAVEESVPDLPAAAPVAGPKPDAAAAAKALADEMGVTKIEGSGKKAGDIVQDNRSKVVKDYLEQSRKRGGVTPEMFQAASEQEKAAVEAAVRNLPKGKGGYSTETKEGIIAALKGMAKGGVIKPMALGGVIQTVSAQKPQVRRSRRGIAYGPPSLMRGMNPPSVPRRKI